MITYFAVGLIVFAAVLLGWSYLAQNIREAIDFDFDDYDSDQGEPIEIESSRLDALRRIEWLREYYRENGMIDSLKCANHAASAMFADTPEHEDQPSE